MENYYYIKEGMMLARSPEWEMDQYGFYPDGIGDCIGRSSKAALVYNKPKMLQKCVDLLKAGKRWPDKLEGINCAKNWLDYWWSKLRYKLNIPQKWWEFNEVREEYEFENRHTRKYRSQKSITRDPIIGVICSLRLIYHHDNDRKMVKLVKIRWWQNRPDLYHWKKYLETGKSRHKRKYEWWAKIGLSERTPGYVLNHMAWMAYVADSDKVQKKLWKYIPNWNLLLELLTDKYPQIFIKECVKDYKAKSGYQWSHDRWIEPPEDSSFYLDEDDEYKLDIDVLNWVITRK